MAHIKSLFIITFLLLTHFVHGQKDSRSTFCIDTLGVHGDSTLVKITYFDNNSVREICNAFLLHSCIRMPRIVVIGRGYFYSNIYAPVVIPHGLTIENKSNGKKIISDYQYGKKIKSIYLDKNSIEISKNEFDADEPLRFICVTPIGFAHLVFPGKRKKCL